MLGIVFSFMKKSIIRCYWEGKKKKKKMFKIEGLLIRFEIG
jgi:hypothetical protein